MKQGTGTVYDAAIIGSGLGGLLCGAILSKEGMKVCVLEKNASTGGSLQNFRVHGASFDTGLHYIGSMLPGQVLYRYWDYLGLPGKLRLERLSTDGFDRVCLQEKEYPLAQGFDNFAEKLLQRFPGKKEALDKYIRTLREIGSAFPLYNLETMKDQREDQYRSQSAYGFYQSLDPGGILPQVLAGNLFLYAGRPETTPLHMAGLINHSFISSAFRPEGGSGQIAANLEELITGNGGQCFVHADIRAVSMENRIFLSAGSSGMNFLSRRLIAAIHPARFAGIADPRLLRKSFSERVRRLQNTVSAFSLFITLKDNTFPYLDHNIHYSDTDSPWDAVKAGGAGWPVHYMLCTSSHGPDRRFAKSLVVMTFLSSDEVSSWTGTIHGKRGKPYEEFKNEHTERLLSLVEKKFPSLRRSILYVDASTPLTWSDHTGSPGGSMYGIEKDYRDPMKTLVLPRTKIPGLFFTGQNINLHGAAGVTIGAFMTCGEILGLEYLIQKVKHGS
jgi:all-trans-retinol 13,14-reductase